MAKDYTSAAALATRLIAKFGTAVSLLKESRTPNDPAAPWAGTATAKERIDNVMAVFVPLYGDREVSKSIARSFGDVKRTNDSFLIAAVDGQDIRTFQGIVKGDQLWRITEVHEIAPGDTILLYQIEVTG
jgi:hypothetical protein